MSSEWVYAVRAAAALEAVSGRPYVLLQQLSCSSSTFPRMPFWKPMAFVPLEECMPTILTWAVDCESGLLRGRNGRSIRSVTYVAWWRDVLARTFALPMRSIECRISPRHSDVHPKALPMLRAAVARFGAGRVTDDAFAFDLNEPRALEMLTALFRQSKDQYEPLFCPVDVWRNTEVGAETTTFGLAATVSNAGTHKPDDVTIYAWLGQRQPCGRVIDTVLELGRDRKVVVVEEGREFLAFVNLVLIDAERLNPGSAESLLHEFGKRLRNARPLDPRRSFVFARPVGATWSDDETRAFEAIGSALRAPAADRFLTTFDEVAIACGRELLFMLAPDALSSVLVGSVTCGHHAEQADLF